MTARIYQVLYRLAYPPPKVTIGVALYCAACLGLYDLGVGR